MDHFSFATILNGQKAQTTWINYKAYAAKVEVFFCMRIKKIVEFQAWGGKLWKKFVIDSNLLYFSMRLFVLQIKIQITRQKWLRFPSLSPDINSSFSIKNINRKSLEKWLFWTKLTRFQRFQNVVHGRNVETSESRKILWCRMKARNLAGVRSRNFKTFYPFKKIHSRTAIIQNWILTSLLKSNL